MPSLNAENVPSADPDLAGVLDMICENQGAIPARTPLLLFRAFFLTGQNWAYASA